MSALKDALVGLSALIATEEYPSTPYVPEDLQTPCSAIQPADPYLTDEEQTFGNEYLMRVEIYLLVGLDGNEQAADDLDAFLEHVLANLGEDWSLESMGQPQPMHTSDWLSHGQRITVTRFITL